MFKINAIKKKTEKHIKSPVHSLFNFLQDFREMICCRLHQIISLLCNHSYELNLHPSHEGQQVLENHVMITTCLKTLDGVYLNSNNYMISLQSRRANR